MATNLHIFKNGCYKTRSESSIGGGSNELDDIYINDYKKSIIFGNGKSNVYKYRKNTDDFVGYKNSINKRDWSNSMTNQKREENSPANQKREEKSPTNQKRDEKLLANQKQAEKSPANQKQQQIQHHFSFDDFNRFEFLKKNFDEYRKKTNEALQTKDAHICKLQERLNSVLANEKRANDLNQLVHSLTAERDSLKSRLNEIETSYEQEKIDWTNEIERLKQNLSELENQIDRNKSENSSNLYEKSDFNDNEKTAIENNPCQNCDYLRKEMEKEKLEKNELVLLNKTQNFMFDEKLKQFFDELNRKTKDFNQFREKSEKLTKENDELKSQIKNFKLEFVKFMDQNRLLLENFQLKRELDELNDIYEMTDIESEEKITLLANKVEELQELLDSKNRECILLNTNLSEKNEELKKFEQKVKNFDSQSQLKQDIIENLRDDLDKQKDKNREILKEKDELLLKNASLSHEVNFTKRKSQNDRDKILYQLNLAGKELEDCLKNLQDLETKMNLNLNMKSKNPQNFDNLSLKINNLEENLRQKQNTIEKLERRLIDIKSLVKQDHVTHSNNHVTHSNSHVTYPNNHLTYPNSHVTTENISQKTI